jgi:DNA replication protein DnaC
MVATERAVELLKEVMTREDTPVVIVGKVGIGKTTLAAKLLTSYFQDKTVVIIDPLNETSYLLKNKVQTTLTSTEMLDTTVAHRNVDIVVLEEAQRIENINLVIKQLVQKGIKTLIVSQELNEQQLSELHKYYLISLEKWGEIKDITKNVLNKNMVTRTEI